MAILHGPSTQIKYYCAVTCEWAVQWAISGEKRCNLKYIFGWFHEWYSYMFKSLISFYQLPSGINIHWFEALRQTDKLHVLYFFGRNLAHSALDKRSTLWGKQAKLYVLFPQFSSLCTLDKRREPTLELFCTYCFVLSYIPRDYSLRRVSVVDYFFFWQYPTENWDISTKQ